MKMSQKRIRRMARKNDKNKRERWNNAGKKVKKGENLKIKIIRKKESVIMTERKYDERIKERVKYRKYEEEAIEKKEKEKK